MIKNSAIVAIILGVLGAAWYFFVRTPELSTLTPERRHMVQAVYATGEVEPVYWSAMSPQMAGKVKAIKVNDGDKVTKGELLIQLDDSVECARASEYMAKLNFLEKQKSRYAELKQQSHTSESKYEEIVSEYDAVKAQLVAQNEVVARMAIISPMDGVVLKRDVEEGEGIASDDVVLWIGKVNPLRITAEVDEEDIARILKGQKALIKADAFPDKTFEGIIGDITPKGDPIDKNFRVRVKLPDNSGLMVGMTVEVNVVVQEIEDALVIPRDAIQDNNVWVIEGNHLKIREVELGIITEDYVQVLSGLDENETILAQPPDIKQ